MAQRSGKKKIIIDGEIYEEGDPRLEQKLRQQAAPSPANVHQPASRHPAPAGPAAQHQSTTQQPAAAAGRSAGLDFSAPPLRVINVPGRPLPDLEIFALRIPAYYVLILVYLVYAFGWRAAVAGAALYYIWVINRDAGMGRPAGAGQQAPAAAGQGRSNPLAAGFADIMDTLGLGSSQGEAGGQHQQGTGQGAAADAGQTQAHAGSQGDGRPAQAPAAAGGAPGSSSSSNAGGRAFHGTGHRLGDK